MSMPGEAPEAPGGILLIGCGSTLRGDDAAGYLVAEAFLQEEPDRLRIRPVHQLTPELAADLADCSQAIFVDAYPAGEDDTLRIMNLQSEASQPPRPLAHHLDPAALLNLARRLYDRAPDAWVIGIPARSFDEPDTLSPTTRKFMELAREWLRDHLRAELGA